MSERAFRFRTQWPFRAALDTLWQALEPLLDSPDPFCWWPAMQTQARDETSLVALVRSPLGTRLRIRLYDLRSASERGRSFRADGDLVGAGTVRVVPHTHGSALVTIWEVDAAARWLRWTARPLRPLHIAMHQLVMRRARRHLICWLAARAPT